MSKPPANKPTHAVIPLQLMHSIMNLMGELPAKHSRPLLNALDSPICYEICVEQPPMTGDGQKDAEVH